MRFTGAIFSTVLTTLLLVPAADVFACSCEPPGAPCQNAFNVDAVFVGTVLRITPLPDDGPPLRPGEARIPQAIRVEFSVSEAFRGIRDASVNVLTAGSGPACGYDFKLGERYLVYAHSREGGVLVTGICTRTRPIASATEDLAFLQTLSSPGTGARLYGTVNHSEWNPSDRSLQDYGPVPNVLVTARSDANTSNARTDSQGRYEMTLPAGKYDVVIEQLPGFSANGRRQTVELRDVRGCAITDFSIRFDGRIKGVIQLASGGSTEGILVEAMAAERPDGMRNVEVIRTNADASGAFEFTDLSPGRYVVGVDLVRRMDPERPFPTTYHPGTPDPALATVVQLEGGHRIELGQMTLPPPRRAYRLSGTVFFADGRPAPRSSVFLQDGAERWQVAIGIQTAPDGSFSFVVHEGLTYSISADFWDEVERRQVRGSMGPIVITEDFGPVKLVLSEK